jgi:hypothetical protein
MHCIGLKEFASKCSDEDVNDLDTLKLLTESELRTDIGEVMSVGLGLATIVGLKTVRSRESHQC